MRDLTRQDMVDLLQGATLLGAGGGGDLDEGLAMIDAALAAGKVLRLASLSDLPATTLACCPYLLGAVSDLPPDQAALYNHLPKTEGPALLKAFDRLQAHTGQAITATVACEMGGANTAAAFFVAAMRGGVTLDADPAGRAVPEITHSTFYLNNLPVAPMAVATPFGETALIEGGIDDARAETLVRAVAQVSANDVAAVDHALPLEALKTGLIPGTMSGALTLGHASRRARETGQDAAAAVAHAAGGAVVFVGQVTRATYTTRAGFTCGEIHLNGPSGTYQIGVKNENLSAHLNGQVHASIPDILTLIDRETGEVISNPHARVGQQVAVLILPAPTPFLTPKGLQVFGPAYAGLEGPFVSPLGIAA